MTNRFLISVAAAALIAGTGFANAQGAGGMGREGGSSAQQSAPSSGGGAAAPSAQQRDSGQSDMKSGQSEKMGSGKQAEDMKGGKAEGREKGKGTVGQAPSDKSGATNDKTNAQGREDRMNAQGQKGATETNQKGSTSDTNRAQTNQSGSTSDTNRAQTNQSGSQTTTGNAATSATAAPPAEKRQQIVASFKQDSSIREVTNVNFDIRVGATIPASVHFYPIPARIVEIYPEWRGYEVIRVKGRYIIVRPQTHEIVYIIEG